MTKIKVMMSTGLMCEWDAKTTAEVDKLTVGYLIDFTVKANGAMFSLKIKSVNRKGNVVEVGV